MHVTLTSGKEKQETFHTSRGKPVIKPEDVKVGTRISIYAIIQDNSGRVLFVRKGSEDTLWELPGGKIDGSENHAQALERECLEEAGIHIRVDKSFEEYPHGQGLLAVENKEVEGGYEFYNSTQLFYRAFVRSDRPYSVQAEMSQIKYLDPHGMREESCKMIFHPILRHLRDNC